jgi:hypothetical protein
LDYVFSLTDITGQAHNDEKRAHGRDSKSAFVRNAERAKAADPRVEKSQALDFSMSARASTQRCAAALTAALAAMAAPGAAFAQSCAAPCSLATLLQPTKAAAPQHPTGQSVDGEERSPSWSSPKRRIRERTRRWTVSAEAIVLGRIGGVNQTLVTRVPGSVPFFDPPAEDTFTFPGSTAFNSNQFAQGFAAGPKVSVIYHGDAGYSFEFTYFNIFNQSATAVTGPDNPADWLVMKAPGTFWQTQDFAYQGMAWSDATNLYSAEANGRLDFSRRVALLAGFRWFQLNDNLVGTLTPADLTAPTWKQNCPACNLSQITPDGAAGNYPPFWNTGTMNNLFGVQVGADVNILRRGNLSLGGLIKLGVFDNNAEQSTGVSLAKVVYPSSAAANHAAFVSEAALQLKYQLDNGMALKAGYTALWLDGVALAPGQIQETYTAASGVRALGVDCRSSVLFQGPTAGLEYSF